MYLVWSNQHGMWWRGGWAGYTDVIHEAGRYSGEEAQAIVDKSSAEGRLWERRVNPVTGEGYKWWPDVAIMAPDTDLISDRRYRASASR